MNKIKGYHKNSLEECAMHQIPITRYKCKNLEELVKEIEKHWYLVSSIEIRDKDGIELFIGDLVEDSDGRLFEIGYCFDSEEFGDRRHIARNEMRCVKNRSDNDHIRVGEKVQLGEWVYPSSVLKLVGNIYQDRDLMR